jgi:hypothetical protein
MHCRFVCLSFRVLLVLWLAPLSLARVEAHPRMIAYGHSNCVSCHVAPQGRGLLNRYGRGIDMEQSLSDVDVTGRIMAALLDPKYAEDWDGHFGPVLFDFVATSRLNQEFDTTKTDPTFSALFRQVLFLGKEQRFRVNYEVGLRDTALRDTALAPGVIATGGSTVFLKKATLEWRISGKGASGGSEIAIGRDYLPLGMQLDDYSSYLLHLNRDGISDYPLQAKFLTWTEKSLASVFLYGPTFDERGDHREYGAGFLYEYYPTDRLAIGVQSLGGISEEADRMRIGGYVRWGPSTKWALLAEVDYTRFWDAGAAGADGNLLTAFAQIYYHHTEWLVSSVTGNYAWSDLLTADEHFFSGRYTLAARLNRNLTIGITYATGDIRRNLSSGQEGAVFATVKF